MGLTALAADKRGHLFVLEMEEDRVLRIDLGTGIIAPVAGRLRNERCQKSDGGRAADACLKYPVSLATDSSGNLLITPSGLLRLSGREDRVSIMSTGLQQD